MRTNPEPSHRAAGFDTHSAIIFPHTSHPVVVHLLEMQRGVPVVRLPEAIILVGQPLNLRWKLRVKAPKFARSARPHSGNGRVFPSRSSRNASAANLSSLPARI